MPYILYCVAMCSPRNKYQNVGYRLHNQEIVQLPVNQILSTTTPTKNTLIPSYQCPTHIYTDIFITQRYR